MAQASDTVTLKCINDEGHYPRDPKPTKRGRYLKFRGGRAEVSKAFFNVIKETPEFKSGFEITLEERPAPKGEEAKGAGEQKPSEEEG